MAAESMPSSSDDFSSISVMTENINISEEEKNSPP
jgi:hypothetical protein